MLVVGSLAFDTLHNPSGTHRRVLGGSALYGALAGAFFTPVRLVGVVGKDYPQSAITTMRERGIDTEGVEVSDGVTFHWEGRYSDDLTSRTSLCTELNVFAKFEPKIPAAFRETPFVMLGNIDPELQLDVLEQVRRPELVVADTMNFWIDGKPKELARTLARVDLLVVNEDESRQLARVHNLVKVADKLHAMGPKLVVIKKGEHGALLFERDRVFSAPAFPLGDVVDPTGAGDTFAGGMLGYIAHSGAVDRGTLRRAVVYGSTLASFCVEGIGVDRLLQITRADVDARYEQFKDLVHFATDAELR